MAMWYSYTHTTLRRDTLVTDCNDILSDCNGTLFDQTATIQACFLYRGIPIGLSLTHSGLFHVWG